MAIGIIERRRVPVPGEEVPTGGAEEAVVAPARQRSRAVPIIIAAAAYLALGFVAFGQAWVNGPTHTMTCGCFDPAQSAWYLEWVPYALTHGQNLFFTHLLSYPYGANLMDNTSMVFLGFIAWPITALFGPVASWNVLVLLGMSGSATAAFCIFRRYARWWPAAFAGGLAYGLGPYMAAQGASHLNLSVVVFPPLVLWLADSILMRRAGNPYCWGLLLGAVCLAQLFVSTEILATTAIMAGVAVAVLVLSHLPALWRWLRHGGLWTLKAVFTGGAVFALGATYPLWMALNGPQKVASGEAADPTFLSANLLGFVLPSRNQLLTTASTTKLVDPYFVGGYVAENATYLGWGMLCVALIVGVVLWRSTIARIALAGALIAAAISLGLVLSIGTHQYPWIWLPYRLLQHLPEVQYAIPARFALYVDLFCGLLLAIGMDRLHARLAHRLPLRKGRRPRVLIAALPLALAAVALIPQLPHWPFQMQNTRVPSYFTSPAVKQIPAGSVTEVYPYPRVTQAQAMLWQAESGMRFRMLGGFVLTPGGKGQGEEFPPKRSVTEIWFGSAYWMNGPFKVYASAVRGVRAELLRDHVQTVIVGNAGADPEGARALITATLGKPNYAGGGVAAWYHVQSLLRDTAAPSSRAA